ncbi:nucleotide-diphospho-sugar transferase [Spinellus fusiger]|nr:nucleotide-diphospho-sugar transferase [Spinellus fusiger]
MTSWTLPFKILYSICISCIFLVPAIVGYSLQLHIANLSFWVLGVYGAVVFIFAFLQLTFATLNRQFIYYYEKRAPLIVSRYHDLTEKIPEQVNEKDQQQVAEDSNEKTSSIPQSLPEKPSTPQRKKRHATHVGLAVVGYREDSILFAQCLESILQLEYPDPVKIVVVIDGDEEEDREMASQFQKAFPGNPVITLEHLLSETPNEKNEMVAVTDEFLCSTILLPNDSMAVCYMQPHRGKRHAMYTAFRVLMASGCDAVMTTDSDTKFDSRALIELEKALYWYPDIGASAGDVRIWNSNDNLLSFMSSLRYWMAFNIERAAQSLNRCVTCVSGPMGLYQAKVLRKILDPWIQQKFLGMECTYGDDRHLTNCVLMGGHRVVYTHLAFCETETPTKFLRWFKQQTRWSKSFYRELLWNLRSFHKHSPWMAAELLYQGFYPFVLIFSIFTILWSHTPIVLLIWITSLFAISSIKTIYSIIISRSIRFLAFPIYSLYYLFGLVPAKVWALISLWDVGWGTSARSASELKREGVLLGQLKESLPIFIWMGLLLAGIAFNIISFFLNVKQEIHTIDPTDIVFYPNPHHNGV